MRGGNEGVTKGAMKGAVTGACAAVAARPVPGACEDAIAAQANGAR